MKKIVLIMLCVLLCFSVCGCAFGDRKFSTEEWIQTEDSQVYEIIIPNSLLSISGISELEYIASFDNETHDVYTDVQLIDDGSRCNFSLSFSQ